LNIPSNSEGSLEFALRSLVREGKIKKTTEDLTGENMIPDLYYIPAHEELVKTAKELLKSPASTKIREVSGAIVMESGLVEEENVANKEEKSDDKKENVESTSKNTEEENVKDASKNINEKTFNPEEELESFIENLVNKRAIELHRIVSEYDEKNRPSLFSSVAGEIYLEMLAKEFSKLSDEELKTFLVFIALCQWKKDWMGSIYYLANMQYSRIDERANSMIKRFIEALDQHYVNGVSYSPFDGKFHLDPQIVSFLAKYHLLDSPTIDDNQMVKIVEKLKEIILVKYGNIGRIARAIAKYKLKVLESINENTEEEEIIRDLLENDFLLYLDNVIDGVRNGDKTALKYALEDSKAILANPFSYAIHPEEIIT
ncbi:MAG: hypothetical protein ACPLZG_13430, partial [Thermoproteota archaeon]